MGRRNNKNRKRNRNLCCDCCDCNCEDEGVDAGCGCLEPEVDEPEVDEAADLINQAADQVKVNIVNQNIKKKLSSLKVIEDYANPKDNITTMRGGCSACRHRLFGGV